MSLAVNNSIPNESSTKMAKMNHEAFFGLPLPPKAASDLKIEGFYNFSKTQFFSIFIILY
jgi:hypothetical protein